MPTRAKPLLNHKRFQYAAESVFLENRLSLMRIKILKLIGFEAEYDEREDREAYEKEVNDFLEEIEIALTKAGYARVETEFKPATHVIATLQAVKKTPSSLVNRAHRIDPGALGILDYHHRQLFGVMLPDEPEAHVVRKAADAAIASLKKITKVGGRKDQSFRQLANDIRELYERFDHEGVGRIVESCSGSSFESGNFTEFVQIVIEPLNRVMIRYKLDPFSVRSIAEEAASLKKW